MLKRQRTSDCRMPVPFITFFFFEQRSLERDQRFSRKATNEAEGGATTVGVGRGVFLIVCFPGAVSYIVPHWLVLTTAHAKSICVRLPSSNRAMDVMPRQVSLSGLQISVRTPREVDRRLRSGTTSCLPRSVSFFVRIMKSRRTRPFPELEEQVRQQPSNLFVPPPKLLKLRMEDLISRGYLWMNPWGS